jgi:two-component system response regulator AtoC
MAEFSVPPNLPEEVVFGRTPQMQRIRKQLDRLANSEMPLLITGASGTGKEVLSRLMHARSTWRRGPFLKINCPAIAGTRLEGELFSSSPESMRKRKNRRAGATLFLDEIGELDAGQQARLLQALSTDLLCRMDSNETFGFRLVSASSLDLAWQVETGRFDRALYHRVSALTMCLPTLAERSVDIPMLVDFFLYCFARGYGRCSPPFSQQMMRTLESYHWPGNIREMENLVKRYVICGSEEAVQSAFQAPAKRAEWQRNQPAAVMPAPISEAARQLSDRGLSGRAKIIAQKSRPARTSGRGRSE